MVDFTQDSIDTLKKKSLNQWLVHLYRLREEQFRKQGDFDYAVMYQACADYAETHPECLYDGDVPGYVWSPNWD